MPLLDIRDRTDLEKLDTLAVPRVLSVMCYPDDTKGREEFIGTVAREAIETHGISTVARPRRGTLTQEELARVIKLHGGRGPSAGFLMLAMIQLQHNGKHSSLHAAIETARRELPEWSDWETMSWRSDENENWHPRSRRKLLRIFHNYGSVAHLWAALVHGEQERRHAPKPVDRPVIWPGSPDTLPTFLGYAERFSQLYASLPRSLRDRPTINPKMRWRFRIPGGPRLLPNIAALPISEGWLPLTTSRSTNTLNLQR